MTQVVTIRTGVDRYELLQLYKYKKYPFRHMSYKFNDGVDVNVCVVS